MPFFIQLVRDLTHKVETVEKKHDLSEKKREKEAQQQMAQPPIDIYQDLGMMGGLNQLPMLPGPGPNMGMGPQPGMGGLGGFPQGGMGMGGMPGNRF